MTIQSLKTYIGLSLTALLLSSTSCKFDPVDKVYHKHTAEDDFRRIRDISLDSADAQILGKFMVDHGLVGAQILELHSTYRDILEEAKREQERFEIERKKKKGRNEVDVARSYEVEKLKKLGKLLSVDFLELPPLEDNNNNNGDGSPRIKKAKPAAIADNANFIHYDLIFKNIGDKDIRAFKGDVNFYDEFHEQIKTVSFTSFKEISVGESIVHRFTVDLNEVNTAEKSFKDLKREFIKLEWLPGRLIHTDGKIIE